MTSTGSTTLSELVSATGLPSGYLAAQIRRRGGRVLDDTTVLLADAKLEAILIEFPKPRVRKMRGRYRKLRVRSEGRLNPQQLAEFRSLDSIFGSERLAMTNPPSARSKAAAEADSERSGAMYAVQPRRRGFVVPRGHPGTGRRS